MKLKAQIPNIITLGNLVCGVLAIAAVTSGQVAIGAWLILGGAFFDFFDGLSARVLGVSGELGKQLDSLADLVTFGVAPTFIVLHLAGSLSDVPEDFPGAVWAFSPVLMAAFAAYRLAKFNIDTRQSDRFIGMPTPAVALFWLSLALISVSPPAGDDALSSLYSAFIDTPDALILASFVFSLLMVAPFPLIALKFKSYALAKNLYRYALLLFALVLLAFFALRAVPIILLLYLILSFTENLRSPKQ